MKSEQPGVGRKGSIAHKCLECALLMCLATGVMAFTGATPAAKGSWKITSIKARSFDQATGELTDATSSSANSPLKWILVTVVVRGEAVRNSN